MTAAVSPRSVPRSSTGLIRRQERRRAFVAAHAEREEIFGGRVRHLALAEIVDDQQRHGRELGEVVRACARESGLSEFFEERVRFTVDDAVARVRSLA